GGEEAVRPRAGPVVQRDGGPPAGAGVGRRVPLRVVPQGGRAGRGGLRRGHPPAAVDEAEDHRADQGRQAGRARPALVGRHPPAGRARAGGVRVAPAAAVRQLGPGPDRRRARRRRREPVPQVGPGEHPVRPQGPAPRARAAEQRGDPAGRPGAARGRRPALRVVRRGAEGRPDRPEQGPRAAAVGQVRGDQVAQGGQAGREEAERLGRPQGRAGPVRGGRPAIRQLHVRPDRGGNQVCSDV
ncbi:MAG: hypothetical protein AVDCRST_MAG64-3441, partial [uncultured Phycisphaerae bacterium]